MDSGITWDLLDDFLVYNKKPIKVLCSTTTDVRKFESATGLQLQNHKDWHFV